MTASTDQPGRAGVSSRAEYVAQLKEEQRARRRRSLVISVAAVLAALTGWYTITTGLALVEPLVLPSPMAVVDRLVRMASRPYEGATLWGHMWASLRIVWGGWLISMALGFPLGILMGWSRKIDAFVGPLFELIRPVPPIAWIPLAIVWFGIGPSARIFVVLLAATVPCVINAREGVRAVDETTIRAARTLGAGTNTILLRIVIPAAAPLMVTGARIALGNAWMTLVGAELLAAASGLGYVLVRARRTLLSEAILVSMATIGLLGVIMDAFLRWLEPRLIPWRRE